MLSPSPSRSPNPRAHHTLPHLHLHQSNTRPPSASSPYPPGRNKQMYATAASRAPAMQYSSLGDALGGSAAAAAVASRHPQSSTSFAAPAVSPISGAGPEATYSPVAAAGVSGDGRSYSAYPPSSSYDYHHHQHQHPYQSSSAASAPASATSPYEPHASSSSSTYVSHSNTSATQTSSLPPMRTASPISHTSIHQQQQTQQQGYSASAESGPFAAANRPSSDITTSPHQEQRPYVIGTGSTPHQQQYSPRASYPSIHSPTGPARGKGREYGAHGAEAAPPFRSPSNTTTTANSGSFIPSLSDLSKMSRTYQQLYDDCLSISQQQLPHQLQQPGSGGKPVSVDRIEELVRAAKKGLQYFHPHQPSPLINTHNVSSGPSSATQLQHDRILSASEDTRNGAGMECISPELSASVVASARRQGDAPEGQSQKCLGCEATSTPEWRRGPLGPRTLCNACGLVYAKMMKKRVQGNKSANNTNNNISPQGNTGAGAEESMAAFGAIHSPTDGGGMSDGELSYGSH